MGLDWIPGARALPGKEAEFNALLNRIKVSSGDELSKLNDQLDTISSFKLDALIIPRVGIDAAADEYMRKLYAEQKPNESFDDWCNKYKGQRVLDLAEPCDGLPKYSNAGMYEDVDITSFRANFLKDCVEIIGDELLEQAFNLMTAEELCAYGRSLERKAHQFADKNGINLSSVDWTLEEKEERLELLDIVLCASRYCLFWGGHGYYMHAWF